MDKNKHSSRPTDRSPFSSIVCSCTCKSRAPVHCSSLEGRLGRALNFVSLPQSSTSSYYNSQRRAVIISITYRHLNPIPPRKEDPDLQYVDTALALNLAPYLHKNKGRGIASIKPANAITLLPHPYPNAAYMLGAKSGNKNAVRLLTNWLAASALLVCSP